MDSFFSGSKSFQIVQVSSKSVTLRLCKSAEMLEQRDLLLPLALIRYVITKDELLFLILISFPIMNEPVLCLVWHLGERCTPAYHSKAQS